MECPYKLCQKLLDSLNQETNFQLVLEAEQRRQILTFNLLTAAEPVILARIEQGVEKVVISLGKD